MADKNYGSVVVVDNNDKVIGICTERDILKRLVNEKLNPSKTRIEIKAKFLLLKNIFENLNITKNVITTKT